MPQIILAVFTWLGSKISFEVFKKGIKITSYLLGWSILIASISFVILLISKVYGYINDIFLLINNMSSSSNCITSNFISGLTCSGILPAINDMLPIFLSAVSSVFIVYSYKLTLYLRRVIEKYINSILD